jgi:hypothetical protein
MKTMFKGLKWFSKYLSHALVIGVPVIAIWGALFPWPPAERTFSGLSNFCHLFVGMKVKYIPSSPHVARTESRSYLIIPAHVGWPRVATVSQTNDEAPKMSKPTILGFLVLLGSYAFAAYIVWRSWFRRIAVHEDVG